MRNDPANAVLQRALAVVQADFTIWAKGLRAVLSEYQRVKVTAFASPTVRFFDATVAFVSMKLSGLTRGIPIG